MMHNHHWLYSLVGSDSISFNRQYDLVWLDGFFLLSCIHSSVEKTYFFILLCFVIVNFVDECFIFDLILLDELFNLSFRDMVRILMNDTH